MKTYVTFNGYLILFVLNRIENRIFSGYLHCIQFLTRIYQQHLGLTTGDHIEKFACGHKYTPNVNLSSTVR